MPITRSEFDSGQLNLDAALLGFLREHSDSAFSLSELVLDMQAEGLVASADDVPNALSRLVELERAESKEIAGTLYYSYNRSLGFRPPRR